MLHQALVPQQSGESLEALRHSQQLDEFTLSSIISACHLKGTPT